MISKSRRSFIRLAAGTVGATVATSMLPSSIQAALAIPAHRRHGNLKDVEHVVILMQENRSFDHYFGTLKGVRGFGDRMAIPLPDGQRVWHQKGSKGEILPYHFDTSTTSAQRVDGTPHTWPDAQQAWNEGRMDKWLPAKTERSLGYYKEQDIAFQFAMANAFTICDAYHCSFQGGTNPNRLFLWTGTNDPLGQHGGPVTTNDHDSNGPVEQGYTWTTYPERLQAAGITWRVYQDMADNFSDNPLIGFRQYRAAAPDSPLIVNGLSTWKLDALKRDVLANSLPQVSWIVAPAKYSEHPGPSSPIWGAEYTSWVLDALTANPEVWSKTALLVMFDENDGFFDHVAPPAAPSLNKDGTLRGKTTADATLEWHTKGDIRYRNQPYGLGPRVPMYVISPWSKGGWVNSQVFDHTSVIRFLEQRFGVMEPNISPWRRAVCGDLTSAFNFANPNNEPFPELPDTSQADAIVASQIKLPKPKPPAVAAMPKQEMGIRPARALPYELGVHARYRSGGDALSLTFANTGKTRRGVPGVRPARQREPAETLHRRRAQAPARQLPGRRQRRLPPGSARSERFPPGLSRQPAARPGGAQGAAAGSADRLRAAVRQPARATDQPWPPSGQADGQGQRLSPGRAAYRQRAAGTAPGSPLFAAQQRQLVRLQRQRAGGGQLPAAFQRSHGRWSLRLQRPGHGPGHADLLTRTAAPAPCNGAAGADGLRPSRGEPGRGY